MPKKKKRKLSKAEKEEAEAKKYRLTEEEAAAFKEVGDMRGWCSFRPRGRPKTTAEEDDDEEPEEPPPAVAVAEEATVSSMSTSSSKKRTVISWGSCEGKFLVLREAVLIALGEEQAEHAILQSLATVPRTTLIRMRKRFQEAARDFNCHISDVTREMVYPTPSIGLLSEREVGIVADIIADRTDRNLPMNRPEVIEIIMQLSQCSIRKKAVDHYDYLVRMKKLKNLRNDGRVVSAQSTTTKRTQITAEQQLRRMETIKYAAKELRRLNKPTELFEELEDNFWGNLDETCLGKRWSCEGDCLRGKEED